MSRRYLFDTHCWLWWQAEPDRFPGPVRDAIADPANSVFLSAASAWEICIKHALGKLRLPSDPNTYIPSRLRSSQVAPLAIQIEHTLRLARLPLHHRDPFDRLLISQAQSENLVLITADPQLRSYKVQLLWVGA